MTVLKSLDLKGNKQSFAGWISNLSPCDTPFVSMIGKEGISQTQYSWQMDALDTPKNSAHEEGSEVVPEKREGTHILHNFTSILRKVAHVSDTVASMSTYGRNKEMEYQMGKVGKELKRDMEFMYLNNEEGNIGTGTVASKVAGFSALCAPEGYVDFSTGAKTHKKVEVADMSGPWFRTSDLFDLTYNLYLAGSKANKIMFHPSHATTFSDFVSDNIETGQVYRMFDGLDTRYNAQVSKIRDPLGQKYDLIPNRFMPKNKIYIFNEDDWTQMILRAPSATKLSKQGSSDRFLLEAEVGLRHRHINASGVMEFVPSTFVAEWVAKPTPLTWGLGQNEEAIVKLTDRTSGATVPDATEVLWSSSNPAVIEIVDKTGHTVSGEANVSLKPLRPGTSIITAYNKDGKASYLATVKDPDVKLTMSANIVEHGGLSLAVVSVKNAKGDGVDGVTVNFTADPFILVDIPERAVVTAGGGIAQSEVTAETTNGLVQVQASVGTVKSNTARLEIVDKAEVLIMEIDRRVIAHGVNDSATMIARVVDATGKAIPNQEVTLLSTDLTSISLNKRVDTGPSGVYQQVLAPVGLGKPEISATFGGQEVAINIEVSAPDIVLGCPTEAKVGVDFNMSAIVSRSDGSDIVGAAVTFKAVPPFNPLIPETTTTTGGIARATHAELSNSDFDVTAEVGNYRSNVCKLSVDV
ncbi:MAG: SU10 major capsid protein [Aeromonas popoffii]|uniref:SU10 major capsid protein n=1 Tax=Aeromonas popoffii TaxID=70856 RepID=UPI003F30BB63